MIISHRSKFIFVHLYKTGGDSITASLKPILADDDFLVNNEVEAWFRAKVLHKVQANYSSLGKHSTAGEIRSAVADDLWESYVKFAFVRDPIGRAVSLYKYAGRKCEERRRVLPRNLWYRTSAGRSGDPATWPMVKAYIRADSFSTFIRDPLLELEPGFAPQCHSICDSQDHVLVDHVGRFERLGSDFTAICRAIGIRDPTLDVRNVSDPRNRRKVEITKADREILIERFAKDYQILHYDSRMPGPT